MKQWFWRTYFWELYIVKNIVCFLPSWVWYKIALEHLARKGPPTRFFSGWSHVDRGVQNASMCNSSQEKREFLEEKTMLSQKIPYPQTLLHSKLQCGRCGEKKSHNKQLSKSMRRPSWSTAFCFRALLRTLPLAPSIPWSQLDVMWLPSVVELAISSVCTYSHQNGFIFP